MLVSSSEYSTFSLLHDGDVDNFLIFDLSGMQI